MALRSRFPLLSRFAVFIFLLSACGVWSATFAAAPAATAAEPQEFETRIRPLLAKHCVECHSGEKPKGDLRLDALAPDFAKKKIRQQWQLVREQLQADAMPPPEKPRLTPAEKELLTNWIHARAAAVDTTRQSAEGRVVLRRLNRVEYENTVRDLLGVHITVRDLLPLDSAADGFDNVGEALHISNFLLEKYLDAADAALNQAITNRPQAPASSKKRYSLKETHQVRSTKERVFRKSDEESAVVMFSSSAWQAAMLSPFYPQERGQYRFRISASGVQSDGQPVVYRVLSGVGGMGGPKPRLAGYFDAPPNESAVVEFTDYMEPRTTISVLPYGLTSAQTVDKIGADVYTGPGLSVDWIEVEGPLNESWPPPSHRRIFGELPQKSSPAYNFRERVEVVSEQPLADAEQILRRFARRAFRRPVTDKDVRPFVDLVATKLAEPQSFEQAVRVGLAAIMVSPQFLFLREEPGRLDDDALACRLSYFLWSTMPDDELLTLAEQRRLSQPDVLRQQVERLLNHPKSAAFTENFVGQWLGLRDIDFTLPSHILYPDFDEMLKASMVRETELFFATVLRENLSLKNFIASDFTMLNGRLAKHYGIPGVHGWEFRKTQLPADSHRGGLLTMASVMKVTANGTQTSPVMRGAWVLERILGTPPPKPPENVGAIEPDIRGATTIRQQLAKHRQLESCASCHTKMDPYGFALESFDVIGGWRDYYRTSGNGKLVMIDGRKMPYLQGPPVDPADRLADGREFQNIDELKQLLLADIDQVAKAITTKLVTYGTGAAPTAADDAQIATVVAQVRPQDYGFRTLIHAIVQSDLFLRK